MLERSGGSSNELLGVGGSARERAAETCCPSPELQANAIRAHKPRCCRASADPGDNANPAPPLRPSTAAAARWAWRERLNCKLSGSTGSRCQHWDRRCIAQRKKNRSVSPSHTETSWLLHRILFAENTKSEAGTPVLTPLRCRKGSSDAEPPPVPPSINDVAGLQIARRGRSRRARVTDGTSGCLAQIRAQASRSACSFC